jgi:hypothetical protein
MYSSSFTIIANSVHKDKVGLLACMLMVAEWVTMQLGRPFGMAQALVGLLRGPMPIAAGQLFAWSLTVNIFPINIWFCFLLQFLLFAALFALSLALDPSLKAPKAFICSLCLLMCTYHHVDRLLIP